MKKMKWKLYSLSVKVIRDGNGNMNENGMKIGKESDENVNGIEYEIGNSNEMGMFEMEI